MALGAAVNDVEYDTKSNNLNVDSEKVNKTTKEEEKVKGS